MSKFLKRNSKKKAIILDIPLYLENGINKKNDVIIYVDANQKLINKRLKKRSYFNKKLLTKFKKIQLKSNLKKKKSSYIIKNNFNSAKIKRKINDLRIKILKSNE